MAIHKFTRLICEDKPIPFFGNGSTARDYTYIDDIIQGVVAAIDRPFPFELFNLGESSAIKLKDLVREIEAATGRKARLDQLPAQPGDVEITCADVSRAARLLGYRPTTPIEKGLRQFVAWFEEHRFNE
jgi:UDP-glucuronate 4-epimerase